MLRRIISWSDKFSWLNELTVQRLGLIVTAGLLLATWYQGCLTREAMFYSERAYVFPNPTDIRTRASTGTRLEVIFPFKNTGHSPGYSVRFRVFCEIYDGPRFPTGEGMRAGDTREGAAILYPQIDIKAVASAEGVLTQAVLDSLEKKKGSRKVYLWGRIDYVTFNKPAFTQFCYVGQRDSDSPIGGTEWSWSPCDKGNDGD
jgi:hypothetical protein